MTILERIMRVVVEGRSRPFLIDSLTERTYTFEQFHQLACGLSERLAKAGVRKGDKVCLIMNNSAEFAVTYFAVLYLGAVVVPVNPQAAKDDMRFIVERMAPVVVVLSDRTEKSYANLGLSRTCKYLVFQTSDGGSATGASGHTLSLTDCAKAGLDFQPFNGVRPGDVYSITHTSGTTASPKGVVHSVDNLFGNAAAFNSFTGVDKNSRFYHNLPMSYMAGFLNLILSPFMAGGSIVVSREFNPSTILDFWSTPIKYKANTFWLPPTILAMLNRIDRDPRAAVYFSREVRQIFVGTAPLTESVRQEFERKYGTRLYQSYGSSEQLLITLNRRQEGERVDSVGRAIAGVSARVERLGIGEAGRDQEGEILIESPYSMCGYYGDDGRQGEESVWEDGWFRTGDLGYVTAAGEVVITGRKKDIIIKGGVNISPPSVERVVNAHPAVDSSVAVGVPDAYYGELVAIAVKLKPGYEMPEASGSILSFCKEHLGVVQQPTHIVEMGEFPYSPTGKLRRARVREFVQDRLGRKS